MPIILHYFSIGSLGKLNSWADVHDVVVDGALVSNTENGLRIKTWQVNFSFMYHGIRGFFSKTSFSINNPSCKVTSFILNCHPALSSCLSGRRWLCHQCNLPECVDGKCNTSYNHRSVLLRFFSALSQSGNSPFYWLKWL